MNRKVIIGVFFLILFGIIVTIHSVNFQNNEIMKQMLISEKHSSLKGGRDNATPYVLGVTDIPLDEIQSIVGEWIVTEWSIVHRQYSKENYNANYDNMIGMHIVINKDGSAIFGEDKYKFTGIFLRDAEWLMGTGIVLGDAEKIGSHTEYQFEALNKEDWMGNKFSFSIIVGENEQWYVTPCYSDVGGYYSISVN